MISVKYIVKIFSTLVIFQPMFIRPTCCWKLDWDELESNQQEFNSLCKVLNEKVSIQVM